MSVFDPGWVGSNLNLKENLYDNLMKFKLLRSVVSALLVSSRNLGTMEYMRVKKLTDLATIPVRGTEYAAGKC